jgi:hypothetical protein
MCQHFISEAPNPWLVGNMSLATLILRGQRFVTKHVCSSFPWYSRRTPKQLWKLKRCVFVKTRITLLIHFITRQVRLHNHCCRGKAISIIYSERVSVVLIIQHAKCMHRIILSSKACQAFIFSYFLINGTIFEEKKNSERKMGVLIF